MTHYNTRIIANFLTLRSDLHVFHHLQLCQKRVLQLFFKFAKQTWLIYYNKLSVRHHFNKCNITETHRKYLRVRYGLR